MPTLRLFTCLLLLAALLAATVAVAQSSNPPPGEPLTSVAIDPTLYRDGAIQRFSGTHDAWSYVCDEVAKQKKRFCSLRTLVRDPGGVVIAALTVSTGEDGRPAALLRMAAASFNETGIEVWANPVAPAASKAKPKPQAITKLYPAACDANVCQMVWTLPPDHISALNAGSGLQLRFTQPKPGSSQLAESLKLGPSRAIEVTVPGQGFSSAVTASIKPAGSSGQ